MKNLIDLNEDLVDTGASVRSRLIEKLNDIIKFHYDANEFVNRLMNIYQFLLTTFLALSGIGMCTSLLNLDQTVDNGSFIDILRILCLVIYVITYFAILCFFGDYVTGRFEDIHDTIGRITWYELPLEIQKCLPLLQIGTQQPKIIYGFMNVRCTRNSFQKMMNTSYSYFTVLRGLNH